MRPRHRSHRAVTGGRDTRRAKRRNFECQRVVAVCWLALVGFALLNDFRGLGLLGAYSKQALALVFVGMGIWIHLFAPSIREVRAYRRLRYWRENAMFRDELKRGKG